MPLSPLSREVCIEILSEFLEDQTRTMSRLTLSYWILLSLR